MSEFGKSTDPRVRRSYAHAVLDKLAKGESSVESARDAIRLANQTRKGQASNFGSVLLKAEQKGAQVRLQRAREEYHEALGNRPTIDYDVEIITGVPLPDGSLLPIVIGAGSHEELDRAYEEGEEIARGPGGTDAATNYVFRRMAEAGGLGEALSFYRGVKLGQIVGSAARQPSQEDN